MRNVNLLEIIVVIFVCLFVFGMMFVVSSDSVCDTPFGAQDLRCVGHYR